MKAHRSDYYHSQLDRHENIMENYTIFRVGAMNSPFAVIVVIGIIIYAGVRTKKLGELISLLSLCSPNHI